MSQVKHKMVVRNLFLKYKVLVDMVQVLTNE